MDANNDKNNGQRTIDEVIYLASLVSNPQIIDPLLDIVRDITAAMPSAKSPLNDYDQKRLGHVREQLIDHLMHHDTLRVFTLDELQQRLAENVNKEGQPPRRLQTLREVGYMLGVTFLSFVAGTLVTATLPFQQRLLVGLMFAMAALFGGISWLSWSGLQGFNLKLRRAYTWICLGYLVTGLGVMVAPLPLIFPEALIFRYGMIMPIFVPASLFLYFGTQIFARVVGVTSWAMSWRIVLSALLLTGGLTIFLPHPTQEPSELYFHSFLVSTFINAVLAIATSLLAYRISQRVAAMYAKAMRWFSITMITLAVPLLLYGMLVYFGGQLAGVSFAVMVLLFNIPGVLMLVSAYTFKRSGGST